MMQQVDYRYICIRSINDKCNDDELNILIVESIFFFGGSTYMTLGKRIV